MTTFNPLATAYVVTNPRGDFYGFENSLPAAVATLDASGDATARITRFDDGEEVPATLRTGERPRE